MKILIIGSGYVGSKCHKAWPESVISNKMLFNKEDVLELLDEVKPDAVLNAAGIIGRPNVDWCETHQSETMFGNAVLPFIIASACQERNTYLLHIGSGCIYYGDSPDSAGWREDDFANPAAVYTKSKYAADLMLMTLPNVGIGRIRMPIDSVPYPGNLIDKLASYPKIIDVENSITVLDDMVQVFHQLLEKKAAGVFHVTNPGSIRHKEIIDFYHQYVDTNYTNEWIGEEDLVKLGLAQKKRSNNILQSDNLKKLGIEMREVHEAVKDTTAKYAENKK
jgi:dTDP-4-dehydrorhamnose reductase